MRSTGLQYEVIMAVTAKEKRLSFWWRQNPERRATVEPFNRSSEKIEHGQQIMIYIAFVCTVKLPLARQHSFEKLSLIYYD